MTIKNKRKALSKKIRFEVFKRDSFTCQYCGKSAPDVVLHIDHIIPVAEGGQNEILNLATSCFDCNMGKSDRSLSDNSIVKTQMNQAKLVSEKIQQIEMMAVWQKGLVSIESKELSLLRDLINSKIDSAGKEISEEYFLKTFKPCLKKFGLKMVMESVEKSYTQYLKDPSNSDHREKFYSMIDRICYWTKEEQKDPDLHKLRRLTFLAKKKWWNCKPNDLLPVLRSYHDQANFSLLDLENSIISTSSKTQFVSLMNQKMGLE